jgi:hypothetical protein
MSGRSNMLTATAFSRLRTQQIIRRGPVFDLKTFIEVLSI